jgi:hypothetical protein
MVIAGGALPPKPLYEPASVDHPLDSAPPPDPLCPALDGAAPGRAFHNPCDGGPLKRAIFFPATIKEPPKDQLLSEG